MRKTSLGSLVALAAFFGAAGPALASVAQGSISFSNNFTSPIYTDPSGSTAVSPNTVDVTQVFKVDFTGATEGTSSNGPTNPGGSTNVFYSPTQDTFTLSVFNLNTTPTFTLSDIGNGGSGLVGTFTATSELLLNASTTGSGAARSASESLYARGNISGGTAESGGTLGGSVTLSLTQTGVPGSSISLSGTLNTPAVSVPEPMSLALLGTGILGLGLIRRRKAK